VLDEVAPLAPALGTVTHNVSPVFRSTCDLGGEGFSIAVSGVDPAPLSAFHVFMGPTTSSIDTSAPGLILPAEFGMVSLGDNSVCAQADGSSFPVSTMTSLAVQIRLVDGPGNASELSNAVQLKPGAGCSSTSALPLGLLVVLLSRRRKSR
jgi:uncharacterized protein (TIGR03382 family)